MATGTLIFISLKLFFGFLLAFLAILAWAKTRQAAWLFIIVGTLVRYLELIYSILFELEVLNPDWGYTGNFPLLPVTLTILPLLFMSIGFLLFLIQKRKLS
ncbi:MAG: hypothetical protein PQJ59_11935 [Spirochaetales bacterium]|nr:hypothetical protein [Spirochaetales bacterium]